MKNRAKWFIVPALMLSIGACKKNEEVKTPAAPPAVAPEKSPEVTPSVETPAPEVPVLGADQRAAELGFVKYLPKDTEAVMSFHNGTQTAARLKASKLWKLIEEESNGVAAEDAGVADDAAAEEMADAVDAAPEASSESTAPAVEEAAAEEPATGEVAAEPAQEEGFGPAALMGTEVTVALGKSSGEQLANLLHVSQRSNYFQMRSLAKALVVAAKTGESGAFEEKLGESLNESIVKDLLNDPESGMGSIELAKMPPLYIAFKTTPAQREVAAQQLASSLGMMAMLGEMAAPIEIERYGHKLNGFKISGAKISEMMAQDRSGLENVLEPDKIDRLLAAIAKKDIVAVSGLVGDYAVLFLGASADDLVLAATPGDSLVSTDALAFGDGYASKELSVLAYGEKGALELLVKNSKSISAIADGLRDGLSGAEGLGDTRDLEGLLRVVSEREEALLKLASTEAMGAIGYMEDGFKLEIFGGTDTGYIDWKSPNKLAHLGASPDTVLFANLTSDAVYDKRSTEFFESLLETAYAITLKVSEIPAAEGELASFKQMAGMFDTQFRSEFVSFWEAMSGDMSSGLGQETALVMDLKGTVPPVPGIPQVLVDKGRFPRIALVSPVVDRAKLSSSWDKMNASATSLLTKVSGMVGQEIPMQKPISSEKNGATTWFFSMPFFNDDFLPSITVGDQWFAASSSKNYALDLIGQAATGGPVSNGLTLNVNFKALQAYSQETLKTLEENSAAILGEGTSASEEFAINKEKIRKAIEVLDDMDSLHVHARREGGVLRSTLHFKTR